jgi:phage baseplate assembly protein W
VIDFHLSYTTLEQAKSNLRNLVLTNRGERVMHPEFGCDIWASLFNNITPQLLNAIKDNIYRQVSIWLSYINLLDVRVQQTKENENRVNIKLTYALYDDSINKETITINNVGNL